MSANCQPELLFCVTRRNGCPRPGPPAVLLGALCPITAAKQCNLMVVRLPMCALGVPNEFAMATENVSNDHFDAASLPR